MDLLDFETWLRVAIETACHPQVAYVMTLHERHVEQLKGRVRRDEIPPGLVVTLNNGTEIQIDLK